MNLFPFFCVPGPVHGEFPFGTINESESESGQFVRECMSRQNVCPLKKVYCFSPLKNKMEETIMNSYLKKIEFFCNLIKLDFFFK